MPKHFRITSHRASLLPQFLLLLTCTYLSAQTLTPRPQTPDPLTRLPFQVTVVETSEAREMKEIGRNSVAFLVASNYDALDQLAAKLRASKESWPTGSWKVADVYASLVPTNHAPEAQWQARLTALRNWIAARPESPSARVALAYFLTEYAWQARGGGYAYTVTDEGWRLFAQRLTDAAHTLNAANGLAFYCPVAWSVLMRVGLGLSVDRARYDALFDKAIHLVPDYKSYYYRRAIYLLPRWSGEPGEWESDLAKSCDSLGGEKGDELYAQVVWCMHKSVNFTNIFGENALSWDRVDRGFAVIEKDYPDSLSAKGERAHLAALARDVPKAKKYMDETEGKVDLSQWKTKDEYLRFANWAYGNYRPRSQ